MTQPRSPPRETARITDGRRLLIVDDHHARLRLLRIHFELMGFEVVTAETGADALDVLEDFRPDVVLSDLLTSKMDGFVLSRAIRALPELGAVPIILVTADEFTASDRDLALRFGATALVGPTARIGDLVEAVVRAMYEPSKAASSPPAVADDLVTAMSELEADATSRHQMTRRDRAWAAVSSMLKSLVEVTPDGARRPDALVHRLLSILLEATELPAGVAFLLGEDHRLAPFACAGFSRDDAPDFARALEESHHGTSVALEGRPLVVLQDAKLFAQPWWPHDARSLLLIPLVGSEPIGLLALACPAQVVGLELISMAEALAGPIAHAIGLGRAMARVVESEHQFRNITESSDDAIVVSTADGLIHYLNPAAEALSGLSRSDAAGRPLAELLPVLKPSIGAYEGTLVRRDGWTVPVEVLARVFRDASGTLKRLLVIRDFTVRLSNRRRFEEHLCFRLAESKRYHTIGALLLVQLDGLEAIDRSHGSSAGDRLLESVVHVLENKTRDTDVSARLGRDRLAILLPHAGVADADGCSDKLRQELGRIRVAFGEHELGVEPRIGVALFPADGGSSEALLAAAEQALLRVEARS